MTDDRVRTQVVTRDGVLDFQRYFVEQQCAPEVTGFIFDGAVRGAAQSGCHWRRCATRTCAPSIICPSNPFISIDPILALPGMRAALVAAAAPVIAVSPHDRRARPSKAQPPR